MALTITRHRFNVADYDQMIEIGVLTEDDRVELIEGEIVEMSPIGSRHAACVARLTDAFAAMGLQGRALLWGQNPIRLDDGSKPQPDVVLLRRRPDFYSLGDPRPEDVLLLIEVADSSVRFDREVKGPLYSRAGIPEYWLVDLASDRVEVYTVAGENGYTKTRTLVRGEAVAVSALDGAVLVVDSILG